MQNVYIKQENNVLPFVKTIYTKRGNSWKWGKKFYGQVRKLSPIYSPNLFLEFAYAF